MRTAALSHVFIGETGYSTGCSNSTNVPEGLIGEEETFVDSLKTTTCAATSPSGFPTFLFAFSDVCPATGCFAGCNDPGVLKEGNGYFGIFHTEGYMTQGTAVAKFGPPSLACSGPF